MDRDTVAGLARRMGRDAVASGKVILERERQALVILALGDRRLVYEAMIDGLAEAEAERRRADLAFWQG